jgi:hypothetical protein
LIQIFALVAGHFNLFLAVLVVVGEVSPTAVVVL